MAPNSAEPRAASPAAAHEEAAASEHPDRVTAQRVRELMNGTLDPSVDAKSLFAVQLTELTAGAQLVNALTESEAPKRGRARRSPPELTPSEELARARAEFLALPSEARAKLMAAHAERQRSAREATNHSEQRRRRLKEVLTQVARWRGLFEGKLDLEVDPSSLLKVSLLDGDELGLSEPRRSAFIDAQEHPAPAPGLVAAPSASAAARPAPSVSAPQASATELAASAVPSAAVAGSAPKAPLDDAALQQLSLEQLEQRLAQAHADLDRWRARYLRLEPRERQALFDGHRERQQRAATPEQDRELAETLSQAEATAREASEERERALTAAREARTEALRVLAAERARLLGVKQAQALFEASLANRRRGLEPHREAALSWARKVRELAGRSLLDAAKETDADRMYDNLVDALTDKRGALREALREIGSESESVPSPQGASLPESVDPVQLEELYSLLSQAHEKLEAELEALRWDTAETLRAAVGTMNAARLELLQQLTPGKHEALLGFGPAGVKQAQRELIQMELEARFHWQALPRMWQRFGAGSAELSVISLVLLVAKLLLALVVFRWWRHRAGEMLPELQQALGKALPNSPLSRGVETLVWYVGRVRHPLEWLLLFVVVIRILESVGSVPEIEYLWILVLWTTVGNAVVRFLDAIAARQTQASDESAALRLRSLRLVGLSVVVLGLALSLTRLSVGQGAIHSWFVSACWWVTIPIVVLLVHWWRPTVLKRAAARHQPSPVISWVARQSGGLSSYLASTVGGIYLLGDGLYRFGLRYASHLSVTQKLLAYLFRREVEKQAERRGEVVREPLDDEKREALDVDVQPAEWIEPIAQDSLEIVERLVERRESAVVAINGERGHGKSSFLTRVLQHHGDDSKSPESNGVPLRINCQPGGFKRFLKDAAAALDLKGPVKEDTLKAALETRQPSLICVDDAQRLVRPLIGGLADIDRLIGFARGLGGSTVWLVAVGAPAWQYLLRARGERALFDEIIRLEPWSEHALTDLLRQRSGAAGFKARFDDLVVPRQLDAASVQDERDSTEHDYARILWDYSKGNPAVALHFWRESLHMKDGKVFVRLFHTPPTAELENLPSTLYFVLRAILQLELALEADIVHCTDLAPAEVADAVRFALSRRYIERCGDRLRLTWEWYRAVTQVLQRQHLVLL